MIHRHPFHAALAVLVLLTLVAPAPAQAKRKKNKAAEEAPPAEEVLPAAVDLFARNVEAMGGEADLRTRKTQYIEGKLSIPMQGMEMNLKMWMEAPDRVFASMEMPGIGMFLSGHDNGIAWGFDPMSGATIKDGAELIESRRDAEFYSDLDYATRYASMKTVGTAEWGPYQTHVVETLSPEGKPETFYFDQATGLCVGTESLMDTEMGPLPVRAVYEDFKEFDGVMLPTRLAESAGPMDSIITFQLFQYDSPDFVLPPIPDEVQALVEDRAAPAPVEDAAAPEAAE